MILAKKLLRELGSQWGQALAVVSVMSIGVALFVASGAAYVDLDHSYRDTRRTLALADLHVAVDRVSDADIDQLRELPSVATVTGRMKIEVPIEVTSGSTTSRLDLRVLSLPDRGEPVLDKLLLTEGTLPDHPHEIVLEKHLAEHFRLHAGDSIAVMRGASTTTLEVSGIAVSAEYLWVARDEHDLMPSPASFGVGWMRRAGVRELAPSAAPNEVLVARAPGASDDDVLRGLRERLGTDSVREAVPADRLPGVRLLQMDVDGYKGMAGFFPLLFLGVGGFIVASILSRIVDAQRAIIGTLAALGIGRGRILAHYLAYALLLGLAGAGLGACLGFALAPSISRSYASELGIPFVHVAFHWDLAVIGAAAGTAVALVAGVLPALHASQLMPAEAMRPPKPSTSTLAMVARRMDRTPLALRMAVRDVLGRPLRSAGTALGVAAALVLVLTTSAMLESIRATFTSIFDDARRYELRVDLASPEELNAAKARFGAVRGVTATEGLLVLAAEIRKGARVQSVELDGIKPDASLYRAMDSNGEVVPVRQGGIVLTRAVARSLGVREGDLVLVSVPTTGRNVELRVDGFADATLGPTAIGDRNELARAFGLEGEITAVALSVRGNADGPRSDVSALAGAAHVEDLAGLRQEMKTFMGLGWVMLGTMLVFSVVLASAILFNTATLGILERRRELGTMRALGRTMRELGFGLTLEHAILCIAGLGVGLPAAVFTIKKMLALYSSDLFSFPFVLSPRTVGIAFVGIALVLLVAQWPALRVVARTSIAEAVRARE